MKPRSIVCIDLDELDAEQLAGIYLLLVDLDRYQDADKTRKIGQSLVGAQEFEDEVMLVRQAMRDVMS